MDRRKFILAGAALAAGCTREESVPGDATPESKAAGPQRQVKPRAGSEMTTAGRPLGLQLYTVRGRMAEDVAATLALVAGVGYREVEFAGYFGVAPADMRRLLDDAGLAAPSAHIGYGEFVDNADGVIEHAAAVGHEFVVVPAVPGDERSTLDHYRRHADNFNRWAEACAKAGLKFGYHNHAFEFDVTEGVIPYDLLLAETDPERVLMEIDLAWACGGGADVLAYFDAWPGRFPLCHIKDFANGEEVDIGEGEVDFAAVFARAGLAGLRHGFVERDHPADARRSIRSNYDAILPLWSGIDSEQSR